MEKKLILPMLLAFVVCVPILMYGNRVEMTY